MSSRTQVAVVWLHKSSFDILQKQVAMMLILSGDFASPA
jgi:hypothetical protein